MAKVQSIQLGTWGWGGVHCEPPSRFRAVPWWGLKFFENLLNIGLRKVFEKLTIDTF